MDMVYQVKDAADLQIKLTEAGDKLVVIDFFASWCGPCKFISPKVEDLANTETNVVFLKVDVDECEEIAEMHKISSMPTFVFVKNSKTIDSFSGANYDKLQELVQKHQNA
ncbi:hypothetical protein PGB90_004586 [Kerria lacca]